MAKPVNPDPADDSGKVVPPLPIKQPGDDPPMEPNPYMGGGTTPA
ncbi:MAG: hypothetical protein ABIQ09_15905 [Jatrophihabitantaceae bacterium]